MPIQMSQPAKSEDNKKQTVMAVVAVVLILIAIGALVGMVRQSQGREVSHINLPPGTVANPKMQWMQDQKKAQGKAGAMQGGNTEGSPSDDINPATAGKH